MEKNYHHRNIFLFLVIILASNNVSFVVGAKNDYTTWVGSRYQIECTMCSACDNPCNTPPPPPPSPPPASTTICPPPPSPPRSGNNYNPPPPSQTPYSYYQPPPPASGGATNYQPTQMYPTGPAPPPPNPIVPYFPYFYRTPPPSSSPPLKKVPFTFSALTVIFFSSIFYW